MHPNDGRVQALKGEPVTIFGDGSQTRSFCYFDDLVEAMLLPMGTPKDVTGPMNLGNPDECTVLELVERVIELTSSRSQIVFRSLPADDPRRRKPDITLARERLGWQPRVPLSKGHRRTVEYSDAMLREAPPQAG